MGGLLGCIFNIDLMQFDGPCHLDDDEPFAASQRNTGILINKPIQLFNY